MSRIGLFLALAAVCIALTGCYSDQTKQLAQCETSATRTGDGQPLRSIRACMDNNGYAFVGFANTQGETVQCDLPAVIQGRVSTLNTGAQCFEPKGWLALKIYHIEVPVVHGPATPADQNN